MILFKIKMYDQRFKIQKTMIYSSFDRLKLVNLVVKQYFNSQSIINISNDKTISPGAKQEDSVIETKITASVLVYFLINT